MTPSKKPKSAKELYEKLVSDDVMDEESEEDDENDQGKNLLFLLVFFKYNSMTSLLTHTVARSTSCYFRLKTNNQPLKMFLSLAVI